MPRGGKRPGAGAPIGNLNGFKHGRRSPRARRALIQILADPAALRAFAELIATPNTAARKAAARARTAARSAAPKPAQPYPPEIQAALDEDAATQRRLRTIANLRRVRAMLTRRIRISDERAITWRTILEQEDARDTASSPLSVSGEGSGVGRAPNQTPRTTLPSVQSNNREKHELAVERAIKRSVRINDFSDPDHWPPSVLDDPLLWTDLP
jgi:hypothetical protein